MLIPRSPICSVSNAQMLQPNSLYDPQCCFIYVKQRLFYVSRGTEMLHVFIIVYINITLEVPEVWVRSAARVCNLDTRGSAGKTFLGSI